MRRVFAAAGLLTGLLTSMPAYAAGSALGTGAITSGCSGTMAIAATNSSGNNWAFDVTVACTNSAPQHIAIAGQWDADTGGTVVGFGNGSLYVGRTSCGGNGSVTVRAAMVGSPLRIATASITRTC